MDKRLAALWMKRLQRAGCLLALAVAVAMHGQASAQDEQERLMNARGPFGPLVAAAFGLAPLVATAPGSPTAEVRIWVWHRGDSDDYLLRLWQIDGRTEGELLALSMGEGGVHSRASAKVRDWPAILRDLEAHAVWTIPSPQYVTACITDTNLIVESYRDGDYRQAEYAGVGHYAGDPQALYDYVFALAAGDPQIASIANTTPLGCG
jgi:hypothetical protein